MIILWHFIKIDIQTTDLETGHLTNPITLFKNLSLNKKGAQLLRHPFLFKLFLFFNPIRKPSIFWNL